ncbi:MAG TPA: tripartite tricarboxylate transporter substrate binding protein [Burkholderiales bacterium]|jgi:tripartite-type tricarboxylate transporter receptor subunit TctC|nr:tripartite tricarboxylate transporter substrate binding protein [Burkholderiales bacterium]
MKTLLAALAFLFSLSSFGQGYPGKPVRIIVPYSPGGSTDILARALGAKLGERWKQSVIVENRIGASGMIGAEYVARAPADGYTLMMASPAEIALNQNLFSKMTYSPEKDFAPVTLVAIMPLVVATNPQLPASTMRELVELAKAKPGALGFASPGTGSSQHLTGELLNVMAGIHLVHVPYKGAGQSIPDVISGQVPLGVYGLFTIMQHVKSGRMRVLAVTTPKRAAAAPEIPTLAESGFPGFDTSLWFGLVAPAATPKDVIAKLNEDAVRSLRLPDMVERIDSQGAEVIASTPAEFGAFIAAETAKYAKVIKQANVRLD